MGRWGVFMAREMTRMSWKCQETVLRLWSVVVRKSFRITVARLSNSYSDWSVVRVPVLIACDTVGTGVKL